MTIVKCEGSLTVVPATRIAPDLILRDGFDFARCSECDQQIKFEMRFLGSIGYAKPFYVKHDTKGNQS